MGRARGFKITCSPTAMSWLRERLSISVDLHPNLTRDLHGILTHPLLSELCLDFQFAGLFFLLLILS